MKNEVTIQVNYDWFVSLNLYAGGPQKTHQSVYSKPYKHICFLHLVLQAIQTVSN